MRLLANGIKWTFEKLGFELYRLTEEGPRVPFGLFRSLAQAYEAQLNQSIVDAGHLIASSDLRPKLLARLIGTSPSGGLRHRAGAGGGSLVAR